jgi:hypothetical protein
MREDCELFFTGGMKDKPLVENGETVLHEVNEQKKTTGKIAKKDTASFALTL